MNFFSSGDQDLQNILGGMSQQQFMQLIGENSSRIIFSFINLILSLLFDYFYMNLLLIIILVRCPLFEYLAYVCICRWYWDGRTRWRSVRPDGRETKQCPVNCVRTVSIKWGLSTISKTIDIYCVFTQSTISEL